MAPGLISFAMGLRSNLRLDPKELEALQLVRLQRLVNHAYEHVVYYRELFDSVGFKPRHLRKLSDLEAIPVTNRETLQQVAQSKVVSRDSANSGLRKSHTSGSTGVPLEVYKIRPESWLRLLLTLRTFMYHGMRLTDRVLTISRANPDSVNSRIFRILPHLNRWDMSYFGEDRREIIRKILEIRPTVLYGSAARVGVLANLMAENMNAPFPLRIVATSAESLTPADRGSIQTAFRVEPFEIYNCTELGDIGWQCWRRNGFHINFDWLRVEIVRDGRAAALGESGEIVATNLYRYAMPLIRYSPGDFGTLALGSCGCGLQLPILGSLDGRTQALVSLPNGACFTGFPRILGKFPEIRRFQVVQKALDRFEINIVLTTQMPEILNRIAESVGTALGPDVRVETRVVEPSQLIQGPGKFKPVIPLTQREVAH